MSRGLEGRTVVVTRARAQASRFVEMLEACGAEVLLFPTIELIDPADWGPADRAIRTLSSHDWTVFTSTNAVERFMDRLAAHHLDARAFCGVSVAAVGPTTATWLAERGLHPDVVPHDHRAEGVAEDLVRSGVGQGSSVLIPRAEVAREVLPDALRERGAIVDVVPVYRNVLGAGDPEVLARIEAGDVDAVTFTSSSTVANFVQLVGEAGGPVRLDDIAVASIGPVTSKTAETLGLKVDIEPESYTLPALVQAMERAFK